MCEYEWKCREIISSAITRERDISAERLLLLWTKKRSSLGDATHRCIVTFSAREICIYYVLWIIVSLSRLNSLSRVINPPHPEIPLCSSSFRVMSRQKLAESTRDRSFILLLNNEKRAALDRARSNSVLLRDGKRRLLHRNKCGLNDEWPPLGGGLIPAFCHGRTRELSPFSEPTWWFVVGEWAKNFADSAENAENARKVLLSTSYLYLM